MSIQTEGSPPSEPEIDIPANEPGTDVSAVVSADTDVKEAPKTLRDVLKDVVQPEEQGAQSSAAEAEKTETPAAEGTSEYAADPLSDKRLGFGKHPRFKEVLGQRDEARGALKEKDQQLVDSRREIEDLRGPATEFRAIENFRTANNLETAEVIDLLQVGALIKSGDAEAALKRLMPHVNALMTATGRTLSPELHQEVEEGRMTEAAARELQRTRVTASLDAKRAETATSTLQTERQRSDAVKFGQDVEAATGAWETATRAKDPDFEAKSTLIQDRFVAIAHKEGVPQTPQAAVALVQRAYDDVSKTMRAAIPKPRDLRRPAASSSSVEARPAPKTMREAIRASVS